MPSYRTAFMSHAHADNAQTDPYADALSRLGVSLYYDRANPQTGHFLGDALQQELERRQTLFVMVTPASIASFWVKLEINTFLGLMSGDAARTLIPVRMAPCQLPAVLNGMWWVDAVGRPATDVIAELARALEIVSSPSFANAAATPTARVVDWRRGMGDHTTVVEAVAAAQPGERIIVRRGAYEGAVSVDKPLELVGEGEPGDVELNASGASVITFTSTQGRVANLTLRQTGGGDYFGVDISSGRLEVEDCDISSEGHCGVGIHTGANPILRRNRIHDSKYAGVFVYEQGRGLLEDNDIFANTLANVEIKTNSAPTLRRNKIHHGKSSGVFVQENGQGLLEDNDIFANAYTGVQIKSGAAPTLRRNHIHNGLEGGLFVYEQGMGLVEDNEIYANTLAGVEISTGAAPTLRRNRIYQNSYQAIWIHQEAGGVFEENDLRNNTKGAWLVESGSEAKVTKRGNLE